MVMHGVELVRVCAMPRFPSVACPTIRSHKLIMIIMKTKAICEAKKLNTNPCCAVDVYCTYQGAENVNALEQNGERREYKR